MITADFHLHTSFSGDCDTPPEQILNAAIQKGLSTICLTDHLDMDYPYTDPSFELDVLKYLPYVESLKSTYRDRLTVLTGVELGLQPHLADLHAAYTQEHPFDFVIGSTHLIKGEDPYFPAFWSDISESDGIRSYLEDTLANIQTHDSFDVYGHLDYIIRYTNQKENGFPYSDYQEILDEILKLLLSKGKGIEVNSGGFKAGLNAPNPCMDILKHYKKLGGELLTIGSDAHFPEYVGFQFNNVSEILKSCGFSYYTIFKERKPEFLPL